jgi:hypothetical protein
MVFEPPATKRGTAEPEQAAGGRAASAAPASSTTVDALGNRVMLLTRDAGFAEVAVLDFSYRSGPTLFGTREQLLAEWRSKLGMAAPE